MPPPLTDGREALESLVAFLVGRTLLFLNSDGSLTFVNDPHCLILQNSVNLLITGLPFR